MSEPDHSPRPPWRLEESRPADRGLVARLVEAVAAADPAAAPEVASGSVRAAQWLQQPRPAAAVVAVEGQPRRVVGYAAAEVHDDGPVVSRVLVLPGADAALHGALSEEVLRVARSGAASAVAPAGVAVEDVEPDPRATTLLPAAAAPGQIGRAHV